MTQTRLRLVFAGTPDFAAQHLKALIEQNEHDIVAVYCPPDKPVGRGKKLTACAVKALAEAHQLPVEQPVNFKQHQAIDTLAGYQADLMIVVAYGLLLPLSVLSLPKLGCINVHGSLLPRWRGAAPIQRAIEAGDSETGVTIMQMNEGLDTGDMLIKSSCAISQQLTSADIYDRLAELGPTALKQAIAQLAQGNAKPQQQDDSLATYARKLEKTEAELDWHQPAQQLQQRIRAFIPWPVCFFNFNHNGEVMPIRVWQASVVDWAGDSQAGQVLAVDKNGVTVATTNQALRLEALQLPGKKALPVADLLNGRANWFVVGQPIGGEHHG